MDKNICKYLLVCDEFVTAIIMHTSIIYCYENMTVCSKNGDRK